MFRWLRRNMKKIFFVTICFIVPPFVIWGVARRGLDDGSKSVGMLYGKRIPLSDYLQARDACMLNLFLLYGPNFRELLPMIDLNRQTWDRMLLLAKASKQGVVISDVEVANQIRRLFRKGDDYDPARYEGFLQQAGLPALVFEQRIRDTLAIGRLTRLITDTVLVTQDELQEEYLAKGEKCKTSCALFNASSYLDKLAVDDAKDREFFAKHREEFRVSEKVKARYVFLSPEDFKKGVTIKQQEIRDLYDSNRARWTDPKTEVPLPFEKVQDKIREELARQKAMDAAFEKATDISMGLFDQPDLEKAAKNAGLKITVTDLFSLNDANLPLNSVEFAHTAFTTDVGKNSPVVKTRSGFAILSPLEKKPAYLPEYEEVKNLVDKRSRTELARAQALTDAQKVHDELAKALQTGRASWQEFLKPLGLKTLAVGPFTKETVLDNVPDAESFKRACFQTATGQLTPVLPNANGALFAYVESRQAGTMENFEKEKENLATQLLVRKKDNTLATWYNLLRKDARIVDESAKFRGLGTR